MLANFGAKINIFLETAMTKENRIEGDEQLGKLSKATNVFSNNFDDYQKERKVKNEIIREMQCNTPRLRMINRISSKKEQSDRSSTQYKLT